MESRHWLVREMQQVGLNASIDGIGNVFGRHSGQGPHILSGSHLETQNYAGWLDGVAGVVAALALARDGIPVDVCAYCDEEGHFGDFLGSRSLIGALDEAEIDQAKNRHTDTPAHRYAMRCSRRDFRVYLVWNWRKAATKERSSFTLSKEPSWRAQICASALLRVS
jgi:hypothetical protein